jgi:hypothetical protein
MVRQPHRPHDYVSRLAGGRPRHKTEAELYLRKEEIRLLRLHARASWATVFSTVFLSVALLTLTYLQWATANSVADIERAKARPHFRIQQENVNDELGFLPRTFSVQADAGVSDATRAEAVSIMAIHYLSRDTLVRGTCRASFVNFYGWTNDAMSFEIKEAAGRLLALSRRPDRESTSYIRLQPLRVMVDVDFLDIQQLPTRQQLMLAGGRSRPANEDELEQAAHPEARLHLQLEPGGKVTVFQINPPRSQDCRNALAVMSRIPWLRLARPGELPQDTDLPFGTAPPR